MGSFFSKIFSKLSGKKELKIIIIGLDNSGKTTILRTHLHDVYRQVASKRSQTNSTNNWFQHGGC